MFTLPSEVSCNCCLHIIMYIVDIITSCAVDECPYINYGTYSTIQVKGEKTIIIYRTYFYKQSLHSFYRFWNAKVISEFLPAKQSHFANGLLLLFWIVWDITLQKVLPPTMSNSSFLNRSILVAGHFWFY